MGAYANRRKFVAGFEDAPKYTIKIVQAQTINGFVGIYPLGLHRFHGCGYGAVDEGQVIISAVRIRTHTQTLHIYDIKFTKFEHGRQMSLPASSFFGTILVCIVISPQTAHETEGAIGA